MQTHKKNDNLRIILTIAGKDILDAIKNKGTLSLLVTALFSLVLYIFLPVLNSDPIIRVYDSGESIWMSALADSGPAWVNEYDSQAALENRISRSGTWELGLILPPDFDELIASGRVIELQGYLLDWVNADDTEEILAGAEAQLAAVTGAQVQIDVDRLTMLPESTGVGFTSGAGIMFMVMIIGAMLVPNLMVEEKRTHTLDALLVSPASVGQIAAGKALTGFFYCLLGFSLVCIFNAYMVTQWGLAILAGVCAALFNVSLGLLLGTLFENRQQLSLWGILLSVPFFIAIIISIMADLFPAWLVNISRWLPTTAAFDLLRASFSPHIGFSFVALRLVSVAISSGLLLGIVVWKINRSDRG